ncbi:MAG: pilus assembly protein [Mesorhizobium sp.]|uniref:TadE/TadG family type IV pilus assembly protein n=1 Tax=unclassified Mesorhizobium TaxID=325217 RepID=UPI000FD605D6|nr:MULTISPECIES: TadE/TadG family type IV pilus assembly protein [unclassified Mesorhizobium]RVD42363.1 pilus assembly protein [Mesorhizobium sp. M4A.F.Ca.ET.020.02.1.1]RWC14860.1 MAG: pilus assembly protein [Mesorhizobium sp.]RWD00587.1 MAG: pilus assembly protein [Mesorhizobium sp.]RWD24590.1 MAG: pilus assembly protein [Mesorhizobium sp.]RWD25804.1 MAG: pilus assembly protein [Mesorhizobium sp.]
MFALKRFRASERGNFAMGTAIAMLPIMLGVAGTIDLVGTSDDAAQLQNSLDAAGLAVATKYSAGMTAGDVQSLGLTFFAANMSAADQQEYSGSVSAFSAAASGSPSAYYISLSSSISRPSFLSGAASWQANRSAKVKMNPGAQACVLALDPHVSSAVSLQGSTNVSMSSCVIAANSDASDAVSRGGSALVSAACVSTVGGTSGLSPPSANLTCGTPLEHQYASFDPLADVVPPDYTLCLPVPKGKTYTLAPGTYCDKTLSGNITLEPGVYIMRGTAIKPGGNGSLTGQGVTIFLMEGAQIYINANEQVNLSPPTSGPYAGITIFENHENTSALTLNGGANSVISGFVYAPDAPVSYAGNSDMSGQGDCLRLVGKTVQMTGNSSIKTDCSAVLGSREMYASRLITLVK